MKANSDRYRCYPPLSQKFKKSGWIIVKIWQEELWTGERSWTFVLTLKLAYLTDQKACKPAAEKNQAYRLYQKSLV